MSPQKPPPNITPLDRAFWKHARDHRLHLQRCAACRRFRFPVSPVCPECGAWEHAYEPVSGRGKIASWVVFHRCYFASFEAEIPYNVALVTLDEGVTMVANILAPNESLCRDMMVEVVFEDVTPDISIPKFQPVQ